MTECEQQTSGADADNKQRSEGKNEAFKKVNDPQDVPFLFPFDFKFIHPTIISPDTLFQQLPSFPGCQPDNGNGSDGVC